MIEQGDEGRRSKSRLEVGRRGEGIKGRVGQQEWKIK